ncbi:MAG: type II secretion system F family protein [Thermoplasmatota archaeon]
MAPPEMATPPSLAITAMRANAELMHAEKKRRTSRWLEAYLRVALRWYGTPARKIAANDPKMRRYLEEAHLPFMPDAFVSLALMNATVFTGLLYAIEIVAFTVGFAFAGPPGPLGIILLVLVPLVMGALVYVGHLVYPDYRSGERRRAIDAALPYAVNYVAAMSSAGVVPAVIFRDLARQPIYGEVSREMAWIARDIDLLGLDLLTAINRGMARSPSVRFQEFLQGSKTAILTGGSLKGYFSAKAEQYMNENRVLQREFLNGLAIMSESYVTVVIAGPLFMLVLLSIMLIIGRGSETSEAFLFVLVFAALPLAHTAFSWVIKTMAPEAG